MTDIKTNKVKRARNKYTLDLQIGTENYQVKGNDCTMLAKLEVPKITAKAIITFKYGKKVYTNWFKPIMLRKMLTSDTAQQILS